MRKTIFFLFCTVLFFDLSAQHQHLPEGFIIQRVAENLDPTLMAMAPDGRIFLAEKYGAIRIVRNDHLLHDPFVRIQVDNSNERGLSGIALHPHFDMHPYVYVYYTVNGVNRNRISRFMANGDFAIPGSEEILLELDPLAGSIHNAGDMKFGTDGKLYVAIGDGSNASFSQDNSNLHGTMLRLNPDGSMPEDNPFYNQLEGKSRAIYAYGFRNPFSMAIQPSTGRILSNDVGGSRFEEVNEVEAGRNYGWPIVEGFRNNENVPSNYKDPLYAYGHNQGCAVVGSTFYEPEIAQFPPRYVGKYFFGDYCENYIKVLDPETGEVTETFATGTNRPISMVVSPSGELYFISRGGMGGGSQQDNTSSGDGSLWKVSFSGSGEPFISLHPQDQRLVIGENARFEVLAFGEAPLNFQWLRDGEEMIDQNQSFLVLDAVDLSWNGAEFSCVVSNSKGSIESQKAVLVVENNTRPEVFFSLPLVDQSYAAGDTLVFQGYAKDEEDGDLGVESLRWVVDFHHDDHTHPAITNLSGVDSGAYVIPRVGETASNVWYRVYLTATDSDGFSSTSYREVFPRKSAITLQTDPPGLDFNLDGQLLTAPVTIESVVGLLRSIEVPAIQLKSGELFALMEAENHTLRQFIVSETDTLITARFQELPLGDGEGLFGQYFNQLRAFEGNPDMSRIDPKIDFDWGGGSPQTGVIDNDNFSIRWTGFVEAPLDGEYIFSTISDDGVRLWISENLVIDRWVDQGPIEWSSGVLSLIGGEKYPIRLEYYERGGGAMMGLFWSNTSLGKEIIPTSQLYPLIINSLGEEDKILIYPNPGSSQVYLQWQQVRTGWISIRDMSGREVFRNFFNASNKLTFSAEDFPKGVYIVSYFFEGAESGQMRFLKY